MYKTITLKINNTEQLRVLSRECGRIYSKTISYIHKIHKRKNIWLKSTQIQKIIKSDKLHSQTVQAIIQKYFASLYSYFQNKKKNPNAKPPLKKHKYYCIPFKKSAIKIKNNSIQLSCGKNNFSINISIPKNKVLNNIQYAEIVWNDGYYLKITICKNNILKENDFKNEKIVSIDPGEIHPLTVFDGDKAIIYNGRYLRSLKRYREKVKATFSSRIDKKKTKSKRKFKLIKSKQKKIKKINNQIKDAEHKITKHFVETCKHDNVSTVVFGDTTHIRQNIDYGKKNNQKLHQWAFNKIRFQISYKLNQAGIKFILIDEHNTSHTCPQCHSKVNPNGRSFKCSCGFQAHRDAVGAINIYSKYQGDNPVVAEMAPASGIRFNYQLSYKPRTCVTHTAVS